MQTSAATTQAILSTNNIQIGRSLRLMTFCARWAQIPRRGSSRKTHKNEEGAPLLGDCVWYWLCVCFNRVSNGA